MPVSYASQLTKQKKAPWYALSFIELATCALLILGHYYTHTKPNYLLLALPVLCGAATLIRLATFSKLNYRQLTASLLFSNLPTIGLSLFFLNNHPDNFFAGLMVLSISTLLASHIYLTETEAKLTHKAINVAAAFVLCVFFYQFYDYPILANIVFITFYLLSLKLFAIQSYALASSSAYAQIQEKIQTLRQFDSITSLANRKLFCQRLNRFIRQIHYNQKLGALVYLDLDNFKPVNSVLSHEVGDHLLKQISNRLINNGFNTHSMARVGNDEFAIFLDSDGDETDIKKTTDKILNIIRQPFYIADHELLMGVSIGATCFTSNQYNAQELLRDAELASRRAMDLGSNQVVFFNETIQRQSSKHLELGARLQKAIINDELVLYYQPKYDLVQQKITSVEALVRWQHPSLGLLAPAEFIDAAEETGLINAIGDWVLKQSCEQIKRWHDKGFSHIGVSVNVSSFQIRDKKLPQKIKKLLDVNNFPSEKLELELTETQLIENIEENQTTLAAVRKLGVTVALDDFGTGYSALSYLKRFPIDTLKIDRSFITDIEVCSKNKAITATIIQLANNLNITTVAEGVESQAQLNELINMGCHMVQGYYISKPIAEAALLELLDKEQH